MRRFLGWVARWGALEFLFWLAVVEAVTAAVLLLMYGR